MGECGACTVMIDGRSVDACLVLAAEADGTRGGDRRGPRDRDGGLAPLQQAFLDTGAVQCGFCIPGQLMAAHALLADVPHPTRAEIEEGLAGNYCRCACYEQIFEAVEAAPSAATRSTGAPRARSRGRATGPSRPDRRSRSQ